MNKTQKIQLIRQMLSGADLSESRCYILEVGEALPADYRRSVDRVIWVTDDDGEIKVGKNDVLVQVTSKETVQQVLKLGDFLDNRAHVGTIDIKQKSAESIILDTNLSIEPTPPAAIPQPKIILNPNYGMRKTHF